MKIPTFSSQTRPRQMGAIMAEAAIGFAIVSFTLVLLYCSTFMADNHIRTAMAARHAAWIKGEGRAEATSEQIDEWFFYNKNLCKVTYAPGVGVIDLGNNIRAVDPKGYVPKGSQSRATVSFGVDSLDSKEAKQFPFVLLRGQFPFMPKSPDSKEFLHLESHCQWDETGDAWQGSSGFEKVAREIYRWITDILKKIITAL